MRERRQVSAKILGMLINIPPAVGYIDAISASEEAIAKVPKNVMILSYPLALRSGSRTMKSLERTNYRTDKALLHSSRQQQQHSTAPPRFP